MPIPIPGSPGKARREKTARREKVLKTAPDGSWKLVELREDHVDEVIRIQQACYEPEYREARQSYVDRIRIYPEGNIAIMVPDATAASISPSTPPSPTSPAACKRRKKQPLGWTMAGYILVQPFYKGLINDVNDVKAFSKWLEDRANLPRTESDCIYVHEIAVDPAFRGQGLALPLTDYVDSLARGANFKWLTLVALGPALGFWKRNGYILEREIDYAGHLCYYMEKPSGAQ